MSDTPSAPPGGYWRDEAHALLAGMVWGCLAQSGIPAAFKTDDEGNYLNELVITLVDGGGDFVEATISILP